ncbi:MAG: kelch repeat-containing protein [Verrucomicrobiota bacterium]
MLDGNIYALGGASVGGGAGLRTVEAYDPSANSWTTRAALLTARGWFSSEAVNGKIYAIGGDSVAFLPSPLKSVEECDPATDKWTRKADMPTAREGFASAVVAGKIYVIGGLTTRGAPALSSVEAYDPATDAWDEKPPCPQPGECFAPVWQKEKSSSSDQQDQDSRFCPPWRCMIL